MQKKFFLHTAHSLLAKGYNFLLTILRLYVVEAAEDMLVPQLPKRATLRICCRATLSGRTQTTYRNCSSSLSFHTWFSRSCKYAVM